MTWDGLLAFGLTALTLFLLWVAVHLVIDLVQERRERRREEDEAEARRREEDEALATWARSWKGRK